MNIRTTLAIIVFGLIWSTSTVAEIKTKEVIYSVDGVEMTGFMAWDDAIEGQRPGVLVVHEWWGQNEYPRQRAKMLAELGYTALALDMYGDRKQADHPDDAGTFMQESLSDLPMARARFNAGMDVLKADPTVDGANISAIGYCYGGGVVLHMARYGAELQAVASFHGSLDLGLAAEGEGADVTAMVVVYNGEDDPFVQPEQVEALAAEMASAGADYHYVGMPGARHGFTNPAATENGEKFGLPLEYNRLADDASWSHMQLVFKKAFSD